MQHSCKFNAASLLSECLSYDPAGHLTASCAFTFAIDRRLGKRGRVFTHVHLLVGLFVCQQDYGKSNKWISTKLSGRMGHRPRENP